MKSVCVYAYFEKDETYKQNLQYFIRHGINRESDYVIVINGTCTVDLHSLPRNVTVINRSNTGYDFGAYEAALREIHIDSYDYFLFLNTSVRGPFVIDNKAWQNIFIEMIKGDVKLVGTTINILVDRSHTYSHVQSQMFAMDRECLLFLKPKIFDEDASNMSFQEVIEKKEIRMSQLVLKNNWNINCTLHGYKDLDYRTLNKDINPTSANGDPSFAGRYFGITYSPYNVVFIKTNRDLLEEHFEEPNNRFPKLKWILFILALTAILFVLWRLRK